MDLIGWQYAFSLIIDHFELILFCNEIYLSGNMYLYKSISSNTVFGYVAFCFRYHLADDGPYLENAEDYKESGIYFK